MNMKDRTVFLDRDGTLVDEMGYGGDPSKLTLFPGAAEAVARLNGAGVTTVLVSNQSGVARGYFKESDVIRCMERLQDLLATKNGHLDGIEFCVHHPTEGIGPYTVKCQCRKPAIGMMERAATALGRDLKHSFVVGDSWSDMEMAVNAGSKAVLVLTGHGKNILHQLEPKGISVDYIAPTVTEAVEWILKQKRRK